MSPHIASRLTIARIIALVAGLCLTLVAVACSTGNDLTVTPTSTPQLPGSATPSVVPSGGGDPGGAVPQVLRFSAPRLSGGTIDGEDLSGRDVAFWFWAPW
ncbi:MAG: hypothetical protein ACRDGK_04330 [Actinomycetota bacterium]